MTMAVLMFVAALSATGTYLFTHKDRIRIPTQTLPSIQTVRTLILSELQNVKELSMLRSNFQSIVPFSKSKKLFGHDVPGTNCKFLLKYTGKVVCGCDLDQIDIGNSFYNHNHLSITIPSSRIFDIYADTIEVYDQNAEIFSGGIQLEDQNQMITKDLHKMKQQLIDNGILMQSNENIRHLLKSITNPLGLKIDVNFIELGQDELPRLT